jgi:hypothetical protein
LKGSINIRVRLLSIHAIHPVLPFSTPRRLKISFPPDEWTGSRTQSWPQMLLKKATWKIYTPLETWTYLSIKFGVVENIGARRFLFP